MKTFVAYGSAWVVPSFYVKAETEAEAIKEADRQFYDILKKSGWVAHEKKINQIVEVTTYGDVMDD